MSEQVLEPEPGNYSCHIKIELYYIMNKKMETISLSSFTRIVRQTKWKESIPNIILI